MRKRGDDIWPRCQIRLFPIGVRVAPFVAIARDVYRALFAADVLILEMDT